MRGPMALVRLFAAQAATALANAQLYTEVQTGQVRLQDLSRKLLEARSRAPPDCP